MKTYLSRAPRVAALAVPVALVCAVGVVGAQAQDQSSQPAGAQVLRLESRTTGGVEIDVAPNGLSVGDYNVNKNDLYDQAGSKIGRARGVATFVSPSISELLVSASLFLEAGQITVAGLGVFGPHQDVTLAVTGGTGIYRSVRGDMRVTSKDSHGVNHYILRLTGVAAAG